MSDIIFIGYGLIALTLVGIANIIVRCRNGYRLLGFKEFVNSLFRLMSIVWTMFATIFLVISSTVVVGWIIDYIAVYPISGDVIWILILLPFFYIGTGIIVLCLLLRKLLFHTLWKYNDREKEFLKWKTRIWKIRIGRLIPWLRRIKTSD